MKQRALAWALALTLPLISTCGGGDSPTEPRDVPEPGTVTVQLSGTGTLGGALLEVQGPVTLPTAVAGVQIRSVDDAGTLRILAWGDLRPGAVLTLDMADTRQLAQVQIRVLQLADGETFEQVSPSDWQFSVRR